MTRRGTSTTGRVLAGLLAVEIAVFVLTTVPGVRSGPGFLSWADGWLQGGLYVTAAAVAVTRPLTSPVDRRLGWGVAAALPARAIAFVVQLGWVRTLRPPPYPSLADVGWLLFYPLLLWGLVALAGSAVRHLSLSVLLDGLTGGLAVGAVAYAALAGTLATLARPADTAVVLVNLAYPLLDVLVLVVLLGVFLVHRRTPPPAVWVLAAGVVGFVVVDATYVFVAATGGLAPGGSLQALSAIATGVMAVAGLVPGRETRRQDGTPLPRLLLPTVFALVALSVLIYGQFVVLPGLSVWLAVGALVIAIVRTHVSHRMLRSAATHHREARTDELTRLANRRAFNETVTQALAGRPAERPLALLIVDLDDFKGVNDSLGHHHGDELLIQVASRLQHSLRGGDLLARIGGDEFAVMIDGAGAELAGDVAERLRGSVRTPVRIGVADLTVTASVGIALFPGHGRDPGELFQHADIAMYNAKTSRTGQALFTPELYRTSRARLETVERLRAAIVEHRMEPWFQPLIGLGPDTVLGAEALVRWRQPDGTTLPPGAFLSQVESAGLMTLLTEEILDRSLALLAGWRSAGSMSTVAVNVSVATILDVSFPQRVSELLERHGVPGEALELELTEDLLMADPVRARRVIDALGAAGVGIVVDDYGTGYSSLSYLRDLTGIRGLKLDRSFVSGLDADARARAIVASTITLARALDLRVVAEGVETRAERDVLVGLGCELAQGYYFGRPMPPEMFAATLGQATADLAPPVPGKVVS